MVYLTLLFWLTAAVTILRLRGDIPPFIWPEWRERLTFHGWMFAAGFVDPWLRLLRRKPFAWMPPKPQFFYCDPRRGANSWWHGGQVGICSIAFWALGVFILFLASIGASL